MFAFIHVENVQSPGFLRRNHREQMGNKLPDLPQPDLVAPGINAHFS
jgi:hypothetical protein